MNLLPAKEKSLLQKEIYIRYVTITCILLAVVFFVGTVMLAPSYLFIHSEYTRMSADVETMKKNIVGKGGAEEELRGIVNRLDDFSLGGGMYRGDVTTIIKSLLADKPKQVSVKSIQFLRGKDGANVTFSGVGGSREALLEYQKKVRTKDVVKEAKFAESFITKKVDIRYTLSITLK